MNKVGKIIKISGSLIVAEDVPGAKMYDVVKAGKENLTGEIIELRENKAWIQIYEETSGLTIGEEVTSTGMPLSVTLAPGVLSSIYDGIQRPLEAIFKQSGIFINRGVDVPSVDLEKDWHFNPTVKVGDKVEAGDILGTVKETEIITHKVMVPFKVAGEVIEIKEGDFNVQQIVAKIRTEDGEKEVTMMQKWPIRFPRPTKAKLPPTQPLMTGQRVIDTFFPLMKGGKAVIPGPFGSGKSVTQNQIAKWSDADIVVYIGCGERGNEMTDVLKEFPHLTDPRSGKALMERTVLIANTSNMPIAAREASIYTGITIAEYFRDMGYDVALMADSTSRWAEALREISGRLEEMPGEEGYPAYLASRIADFYERAGYVDTLGSDSRQGSITVIGAVSPPGGDMTEPVSQNSLRIAKVFWGLEASLAYARHYPAINWLTSYSLYNSEVHSVYRDSVNPDFPEMIVESQAILQKESNLIEIIKVVGTDSLSLQEKVLLEIAKSLREDFLQQNAFDDIDTYSSLEKQYFMLKAIMNFYHKALELVENNSELDLDAVFNGDIRTKIKRLKGIPEEKLSEIKEFANSVEKELSKFENTTSHDQHTDLTLAIDNLE